MTSYPIFQGNLTKSIFIFNSHPRVCLLILERGYGKRERQRDKHLCVREISRYVLSPGMQSAALWYMGQCHLAPSQAYLSLKILFIF